MQTDTYPSLHGKMRHFSNWSSSSQALFSSRLQPIIEAHLNFKADKVVICARDWSNQKSGAFYRRVRDTLTAHPAGV
jgi:hypothetical protein